MKSCGRLTDSHAESSNAAACAPSASPALKRQPSSKDTRRRGADAGADCCADGAAETQRTRTSNQREIANAERQAGIRDILNTPRRGGTFTPRRGGRGGAEKTL